MLKQRDNIGCTDKEEIAERERDHNSFASLSLPHWLSSLRELWIEKQKKRRIIEMGLQMMMQNEDCVMRSRESKVSVLEWERGGRQS